jgi:amidase
MQMLHKTVLCLSLAAFLTACNDSDSDKTSSPVVQPIAFEPLEATIADVHASIQSKGATCVEIVQSYLDRIEAYDKKGPTLNSVIQVNESALAEAKALDDYFAEKGELKGQLHCVTVLPKDNIDTFDMPNTAGSPALANNIPDDDAYIIKKIREAGGIILGKANLDEFAFGFGGSSSHAKGGQTKNVYDLTKGPGGSSAGTGAAISASLATVGIGTDTGGSIRVPSSVQGLVGLRPSLRLVSQDGIIPLAPTQDTAGPMCRQAIDCAILMDSMVGFDSSPSANQRSEFARTSAPLRSESAYRGLVNQPTTYVPADASLVGKRIGLVRSLYPQPSGNGTVSEDTRLVTEAMDKAVEKLREAGAIVEEITISDLSTITSRYSSLSSAEFKISLTQYLKTTNSIYQSYDDLLASGLMIRSFSNYNTDPTSASYIENYERNTTERSPYVRLRMNSALDNVELDGTRKGLRFDAIAFPSITGFAGNLGGSPTTGTNNRLSPFSGFPALSMPAASVEHPTKSQYPMNVNIEFIAREFDEPTLFDIAVAFQKVNPARQVPVHTPSLKAAL